ncbi:MAG TPA: aminopeptidase [Vicinamibacterales bacterium]
MIARGVALILVAAFAACSLNKPAATIPPPSTSHGIVADMKAFEQTLGVDATENFLRYSDGQRAVYRCYFTGTLELPGSYAGLHITPGNESGCSVDQEKYDVFFYPVEAVASGASPVTPALADASLERVLVVVPHEDFHSQSETRRSSADVAEAAATLIGFLAATEFARSKYGEGSQVFQGLDREAGLFLQKAILVNRYHDELSDLYASFRSRTISRQAALIKKQELFAHLKQECAALTPDPVSFNKCPAALNNAGLAFDSTYTRQYPAMFDLHQRLGKDTKATIQSLRQPLAK